MIYTKNFFQQNRSVLSLSHKKQFNTNASIDNQSKQIKNLRSNLLGTQPNKSSKPNSIPGSQKITPGVNKILAIVLKTFFFHYRCVQLELVVYEAFIGKSFPWIWKIPDRKPISKPAKRSANNDHNIPDIPRRQ